MTVRGVVVVMVQSLPFCWKLASPLTTVGATGPAVAPVTSRLRIVRLLRIVLMVVSLDLMT
jgi:hypothetical protein